MFDQGKTCDDSEMEIGSSDCLALHPTLAARPHCVTFPKM